MINRVVLVGNLTRDPQYFKTQSGISYARFTVAVNRSMDKTKKLHLLAVLLGVSPLTS